ncbi:Chloramphenicol acetyltransferase-like domain containing protein [Trema orientale]|uniref:Chloramphenicol acetyltransferase-like domain containing protein n=1 Tax=Trema orientale TaxID=63057 RepID=A0A2P5F8X2_TREOI|nr:Chloramphenicol acetyltransferase-like domain containing protein [Trema orientale]
MEPLTGIFSTSCGLRSFEDKGQGKSPEAIVKRNDQMCTLGVRADSTCMDVNLGWERQWRSVSVMQTKFNGKVSCYPGHGGGSIDSEICLFTSKLCALLSLTRSS